LQEGRYILELMMNLFSISVFHYIGLTNKIVQEIIKILRGASTIAKWEKKMPFTS